ncbi:hypothetical protein THAOC_26152, partial [Thalassiosira oceanica]
VLFDPASIFRSPPPEPAAAAGYRAGVDRDAARVDDDDPAGCWAELPAFEMRDHCGRFDDEDGGALLPSFDDEGVPGADERDPCPEAALPHIDCEEDLGDFAQLFLTADA